MKQKIMDACADIELKISEIQRDLRDCNVIMARTIGRCIWLEQDASREEILIDDKTTRNG